jgi:DNA polymerase I-like protein with 3'-5' exonuclease and polymerase domains
MQLNLDKSEAERLMNVYFDTFPKIKDFIENAHKFAKYNQFSLTALGQRKRQYGTYPCFKQTAAFNGSLRNSANVLIQSTTSTLGLATFTELNSRIKKYGAISTCTVNVGGSTS